MQEYLDKGIKDIIRQFPKVSGILDAYHIGCAPCNVGSCLLKDIVEIHNLSIEDEKALLSKIAEAIYPGRKVTIPEIARKQKPKEGTFTYSPPMKKLVDEHLLIKRWIALVPAVIERLDMEPEEGMELIAGGMDFIRSYADKFHHAKEEEILFKYFDESLDVLKVMREDHEAARGHVKTILEALAKKDKAAIAEHLNAYKELLSEHIKKEDEILYPWMDRNFSTTQVGELFSKFSRAEEEIDPEVPKRSERFIMKAEAMLKNVSEKQKEHATERKEKML